MRYYIVQRMPTAGTILLVICMAGSHVLTCTYKHEWYIGCLRRHFVDEGLWETSKILWSSIWALFYQTFGESHFYMNVIGRFKTRSEFKGWGFL